MRRPPRSTRTDPLFPSPTRCRSLGSDIDDARLIEVAKSFFTDIRDVAGNVFRPQLCVAGHDFKFLDMDRGKDVVLHDPFRDQDGEIGRAQSELQSLMRISYAVFCLKKKNKTL